MLERCSVCRGVEGGRLMAAAVYLQSEVRMAPVQMVMVMACVLSRRAFVEGNAVLSSHFHGTDHLSIR